MTDLPIPAVAVSEVMGLVELLKNKGGHADIYKLAQELQIEFGDTLKVIRGAELLGLVNTPGGDVVLEAAGQKIASAKVPTKKKMIREQFERIPVVAEIKKFLNEAEEHEVTRERLLEKLAELIPNADVEETFTSLINWSRYAELFGYNDDQEKFYLDQRK